MKKGLVIASAVAAAMVLAGCSHEQPMPVQSQYQTAPGGKLGYHCRRHHHCKKHHCGGHHCKGNSCKGNSCNTYSDN